MGLMFCYTGINNVVLQLFYILDILDTQSMPNSISMHDSSSFKFIAIFLTVEAVCIYFFLDMYATYINFIPKFKTITSNLNDLPVF